ncbi:hypothetical protein CRG98_033832 [Punica granatum]|uniref:Uncharacterized protein n=1 Tax=Punica granatum TaxID=22663 RepID=A0A2I0IP96_PUNGR|nr:hypothetical protein CRG98_033832 [Punica granatum]
MPSYGQLSLPAQLFPIFKSSLPLYNVVSEEEEQYSAGTNFLQELISKKASVQSLSIEKTKIIIGSRAVKVCIWFDDEVQSAGGSDSPLIRHVEGPAMAAAIQRRPAKLRTALYACNYLITTTM